MFYCENCRIKKNWPRPATFPFHTMSYGTCEVCHLEKNNYKMPLIYLRPINEQTAIQKTTEQIEQEGFRQRAEALQIAYVYGPFHGRLNVKMTKQLQQIIVYRNQAIDWRATYELRLKTQIEHYRMEEIKRDKGQT